jgi:hypothetical protein
MTSGQIEYRFGFDLVDIYQWRKFSQLSRYGNIAIHQNQSFGFVYYKEGLYSAYYRSEVLKRLTDCIAA